MLAFQPFRISSGFCFTALYPCRFWSTIWPFGVNTFGISGLYQWYGAYQCVAKLNGEQYYGPTLSQLLHLFATVGVNTLTLFALFIVFVRSAWGLMWNTTTIEEWVIERHETLLHRAKLTGGILDGPDGLRVRIQRQEFPYDIGIWKNLTSGMGTANVRLTSAFNAY